MKHSRLAAWLLGFPGLLLAIAFILISMHQNNLVQNHQANDFTFVSREPVYRISWHIHP